MKRFILALALVTFALGCSTTGTLESPIGASFRTDGEHTSVSVDALGLTAGLSFDATDSVCWIPFFSNSAQCKAEGADE